MLVALLVAVVSVALGAALGLLPGRGNVALGPIRTFGLTASVAVVVTHLLPAAAESLGFWALGLGLCGFALPRVLGSLVRRLRAREHADRAALEVGFVGLVLHHLGDGIAMGTLGNPDLGGHAGVALGLGAHTVPVVAIVLLALGGHERWRSGLGRALVLAATSVAGVLLGAESTPLWFGSFEAWVSALVSGLLLHVVTHDLSANPPRSAVGRTLDLGAGALGVAATLVGGGSHGHGHDHGQAVSRFLAALWDIGLDTAPMLLLGLLAGALLSSFGSTIPRRWLTPRGTLSDGVRGAVIGLPLPLCSCGVLPVARALSQRRASAALVVAFLISTPELGIETFTLTVRFLGLPYALLRLAGALLVAIVAGIVVAKLSRRSVPDTPAESLAVTGDTSDSRFRRVLGSFDELLEHIGAWMVLGVVVAALVEALLPAGALAQGAHPLVELSVMSLVTIPSYICAPSATPLAAVLIAKGVSPGAVLVGLLLGPATNVATLLFLRQSFGTRAMLGGVGAVLAVSWLLAFAVNLGLPVAGFHTAETVVEHDPGPIGFASGLLLVILLVRSMWSAGVRNWLAAMLGPGTPEHAHAHGHGHGHGHGT